MIAAMPRANKGNRTPHMVRVPDEHAEVYRRAAAEAGMAVGPYLAWALALAHGLKPAEEPPALTELNLELNQPEQEQAMAS